MRQSYVNIFLHAVWHAWDNLPLINAGNEPKLYSAIHAKCTDLKCRAIAIGGTANHVLLLVVFLSTLNVARFMKELKGSTTHLMTHVINTDEFFKWKGAYAAFSVSEKDLPQIKAYILNQKAHHRDNQSSPNDEF